ncbi:winged helix-turn-helix transcriptional regulator [Cedecea neteri]|uniref:winged helix-turn-helix domain-containing protein n=1 Tax=Cedecea neteri TaxID=158822 RepID=UPI002AA75107|nr:winged helix-turn-helix transcriptional regulator [Cedecea neteri]WPU24972.1 winged helix-turn-helix transcriptional regulator [Cedecea neteri]
MGIILEALKQHEKITAQDLAKVSGLEPKEVISILQRMERAGRVRQCNGFWHYKSSASRRGATVEKIGLPEIVRLVACLGPVRAGELADLVNANRKAIGTSLCNAFAAGQLSRTGKRSFYVYEKKNEGRAND